MTHNGIWTKFEKELNAAEKWLEAVMPAEPSVEELRQKFMGWVNEQAHTQGLSADAVAREPGSHRWPRQRFRTYPISCETRLRLGASH